MCKLILGLDKFYEESPEVYEEYLEGDVLIQV